MFKKLEELLYEVVRRAWIINKLEAEHGKFSGDDTISVDGKPEITIDEYWKQREEIRQKYIEEIVKSKLSFLEPTNGSTDIHKRIIESLDDEQLCDILENTQKINIIIILRRFKKLELLKGLKNKEIENIIREASICYLYGLFNGCIVLCRAAVEEILQKIYWNVKVKTVSDLENMMNSRKNKCDNLEFLINSCQTLGILSKDDSKHLNRLREIANKILHEIYMEKDENKVVDLLNNTKSTLSKLVDYL